MSEFPGSKFSVVRFRPSDRLYSFVSSEVSSFALGGLLVQTPRCGNRVGEGLSTIGCTNVSWSSAPAAFALKTPFPSLSFSSSGFTFACGLARLGKYQRPKLLWWISVVRRFLPFPMEVLPVVCWQKIYWSGRTPVRSFRDV